MKDFFAGLLANWKTTLAGLLAALTIFFNCWSTGGGLFDCLKEALPVIFVGGGLLFARDAGK